MPDGRWLSPEKRLVWDQGSGVAEFAMSLRDVLPLSARRLVKAPVCWPHFDSTRSRLVTSADEYELDRAQALRALLRRSRSSSRER